LRSAGYASSSCRVAVALRGTAELQERLAVHRARLEGRAAETRQLLLKLDLLIEGKEPLVPQQPVNPKLEDVPPLRVAVIAAHVPVDRMFAHVPTTISRVGGWLERKDVPCTGNALILHLGIVDDALDVEVGFPIGEAVDGDEVVSVRMYPGARAAVLEHRGPYEELPRLYGPLEEWIRDQGLTPATPIREQYVKNPFDTTDPEEWVTRISWPLG
jgi:AraC family transcriptional regulator